jgi:hypothetical protein
MFLDSQDWEKYLRACLPLWDNGSPLLPTTNPPPPQSSGTSSQTKPLPILSQGVERSMSGTTFTVSNEAEIDREIERKQLNLHICINKLWTEPVCIVIQELSSVEKCTDDETLYRRIRKKLHDTEGWTRYFSWKIFQGVDFVQV